LWELQKFNTAENERICHYKGEKNQDVGFKIYVPHGSDLPLYGLNSFTYGNNECMFIIFFPGNPFEAVILWPTQQCNVYNL